MSGERPLYAFKSVWVTQTSFHKHLFPNIRMFGKFKLHSIEGAENQQLSGLQKYVTNKQLLKLSSTLFWKLLEILRRGEVSSFVYSFLHERCRDLAFRPAVPLFERRLITSWSDGVQADTWLRASSTNT